MAFLVVIILVNTYGINPLFSASGRMTQSKKDVVAILPAQVFDLADLNGVLGFICSPNVGDCVKGGPSGQINFL